MELKRQVLRLLEENRGNYIKGSVLAAQLFVTRSSIWKAIKALQKDGYRIEAVTNKGYCLLTDNDLVSVESIRPFLRGDAVHYELEFKQTVTSTNTLAKEMAAAGAGEGTVIIAREQTQGRGRMGRSFYSPASTGIYLSVIIRPKLTLEDSLLITTTTAVAVAKAIETVAGVNADIKWVNDIFVEGKKVCGILTEASLNFESGGLEYAVVGIGLNINTDHFPEDIRHTAGSIFQNKPAGNPITSYLTAEILNNLADAMNSITDRQYLEEYRKRSFLLGKNILVLKGKNSYPAKAIDIDDKARLVVEYEDHTREALLSGEVSVRENQNISQEESISP